MTALGIGWIISKLENRMTINAKYSFNGYAPDSEEARLEKLRLLRAVIEFSLNVLNAAGFVASSTPSEVTLLCSISTMIASIITCLPGTSKSEIIILMSSRNSGGARVRIDLVCGSGTKRTLPIILLIGISSSMPLRAPEPDHGGV